MNIRKVLVHGSVLGLGIVVWSQVNHLVNSTNALVGIIFSVLFVSMYVAVTLTILKGQKLSELGTYASLVLTGLLACGIISLSYLLLATVIDPSYINDQIARSRHQWVLLHYSADQIRGQLELTDTFRDPKRWSFILFVFNFSFFLVIGLAMIFIKVLRREFRARVNPDRAA